MATTNVPSIQFTDTGLVIPSEAAVLAGVLQDFQSAFGTPLNTALNTPQGQLATSLAAVISNNNALIAEMVNGMNPDLNSGFMQDVIARIFLLQRFPALPTTVQCTVTGLAGLPIPAGALAQDTAGNTYVCIGGGTIPLSGSTTVTFENVVPGAIACPAGTLTTIYTEIPGWDSINNPADGIIGQYTETRGALDYRRRQTVAGNAVAVTDAIYTAVTNVPGVTDCYVYQNFTGSTVDIGSTAYPVTPHSVFIGVVGGDANAVALAIWTKKDLGCDMVGNTTVVVTDPNLPAPGPTYSINFNNNALNPAVINFTVTVGNVPVLPSTIQVDVENAVAGLFNGTNGTSQKLHPGQLLTMGPYYGVISACIPGQAVNVLTVYIGSDFTGTGKVTNDSTTLTMVTVFTGSLSIGTPVTGTGIPAGTTIVQQLSGAPGGVGTYQLSLPATSTTPSAVAVTGTATGTSQLLGVDQNPLLGTVTTNVV